MTFFSLFFFLSFIKLGFWQLDRKDEKIKLIMKKAELSESQGILSSDISSATESGTPVSLKGAFDKKVILLLDNKILDGVVGFEVLHLFRDSSGLNFLVNRGLFLQRGLDQKTQRYRRLKILCGFLKDTSTGKQRTHTL